MGYTALLVFAGLQTIPDYVYEAASVDGSTEWKSFWRITLPLLRPILALVLVITVTGSFQVFDTVAVTTRGGPVNATRVMQYYIFQKGFTEGQFGYASALSVILFIILAAVALIQLRTAERRRIRPGLRGVSHGNHQPLPSRVAASRRDPRPRASGSMLGRVAAWTAMIILILITLFPFYWMLRTAFSTSKSLFTDPASLLPVDFTLGAFKRVLGLATPEEAQAEGGSGAAVNFWLLPAQLDHLRHAVATAGQVFFSALAAYAFARLRWPGRDKVFFLFLTALMVPPIFTMLPNFILIKNLGLLNTFPGLIPPYFFMTPFAIFFLRQFFLGINREIEEAAKLDGAGHWRIFFRIILPMSTAPIITLFILTFITHVERVLLAAAGRHQRQGAGAHGGARRVPIPDPAGQPGLGRPDGRGPRRRAADPDPVLRVREEDRQLDRLLRHEVTPVPFDPSTSPGDLAEVKLERNCQRWQKCARS